MYERLAFVNSWKRVVTEVLYRIQAVADALTNAASARMTTVYPKSVSQKAGNGFSSAWESGLAKLEPVEVLWIHGRTRHRQNATRHLQLV